MINFIAKRIARFFVKRKNKPVENSGLKLTREEILRIKKDRAIKEWEDEVGDKKKKR